VQPRHTETALSPQEVQRLRELEASIAEGFDTFLKIGVAFAEIRFGRLYRATHPTFESYCQTRWALSLSRCNQIHRTMAVYDTVVAAVPQDAALLAETNEHTLRPLCTLSQELQPLAWQLVRRIKDELDAATVEEVVNTLKAAVTTGWQERESQQVAQSEATQQTSCAPSRGRNGTTSHHTDHRQSDELASLSRWCNKLNSWDPAAIAAADDELRLKRHLQVARRLRTFCEVFIAALETRLSN
jgi:hypothetical protein